MHSWFRAVSSPPCILVFCLVSAVFFLAHLAPGDPLDQVLETEWPKGGVPGAP